MSRLTTLLLPDLHLFGDGAEGGEAPGANMTAPAAGELTGEMGDANATEQEAAAPSVEERTKAYKDLINGEYKDIHTAEIQKIIDRRFKTTKELEKRTQDQQDVLDRLAARYGTTDLAALGDAIDHDSSLWEEEADKAGLTVEQYVQIQNLQRQNDQLMKEQQQMYEEQQRQAQVQKWLNEAQHVGEIYPGFDLEEELTNPAFANMLNAGVPMEHAFKVMHLEEIESATARSAAAQAEKAVTDNIRAKGSRPSENGSQSHSAFTTSNNIENLSRESMEALVARARRGEIITLK